MNGERLGNGAGMNGERHGNDAALWNRGCITDMVEPRVLYA